MVPKIDGIEVFCKYDDILSIDEVRPNSDNPNIHPDEQIEKLAQVIKINGWRETIKISEQTNMIVKGHGRYFAAIRAGLTKVPVEYQKYSSYAVEVSDMIADNTIGELSIVDQEEAKKLIDSLDGNSKNDIDFDLIFDLDNRGTEAEINDGGNSKRVEIEFSRELLLEHNYIVLYFDNPLDWKVELDKFNLKKVRDLVPRKG